MIVRPRPTHESPVRRRRPSHSEARSDQIESQAGALPGRYVLQDEIGRGGMATVYRALDMTLDRSVAVKMLHPQICREPEFVERFLDMELRIARLFHPHLVTIFDAGRTDETCFVVMEDVSGGSLRDLLAVGSRPSAAEVLRIVSQVAEALELLHAEGIIHGDIKPDNVLLDDDGNAKLVDFGIAHLATTTGAIDPARVGGSAPYLAPEQIEHGKADARSDVYALGLLAYELLSGRKPFDGGNWVEVATQRLARDPAPLVEARPDLPPEVSWTVMRALARDPERRFQSAEQFRQAIERVDLDASPPDWAVPEPVASPGRWEGPSRAITRVAARLRARRPALVGVLGAAAVLGLTMLAPQLAKLLNPPHAVRVPELVGQSVDSARVIVREAGLTINTAEEASDAVPRGVVLRQEPPASTTIQSDQPIRVGVSSGPPPVSVPDLRRRRLDDARSDLVAAGLALGKVEQSEVTGQPWGAVITQSARQGSTLPRGSAVDVTVAISPWTSTPKLIDQGIGDAETELDKRGLRLGSVRLEPVAGRRAGTVVAQDPAPDVRLRQGQTVGVVIAVPAPLSPASP